MAEVDQNDVLRIVLRQTLNAASAVENVFHLKCGIAGGTTNAIFLADAATFVEGLLDLITDFQGIGFTYDDIYCFNETKATPIGTTDVPTHENGTEATTHELPAHVAAGLYALTGVSKVVGKKFFGGFTELNNIAGGLVDSDLVAALANVAAYVYDTTITIGGRSYSGGVYRRVAAVLEPVVESFVNNIWYSQRRRRRGVGA